ncbi:MAG TPA: hypothetical protein VKA14_00080 [Gammaproteobacteria bacterium]|nr:hypothetical protein [Gammaproteobacteria bacterium]
MKRTPVNFKARLLPLVLAGIAPVAAWAAPSSTSPYVTDPQSTWVHDATSDGIANVNMVLCIMHSLRPEAMVNKGPYVALVDKSKCDSSSQASTSNSTAGASGATSAPDYMNAVVNVTRASNSDPMVGTVWMSMTDHGMQFEIYVHLTATQSPSEAPPYGTFRVDYISKLPNGSTGFNGFIDAAGADVTYFETGQFASDTALAMTATSTTAGSGSLKQGAKTFNFAYDGSEVNYPAGAFRRYDGTADVCFDRSEAAAEKSVWRYGTYKASDGSRLDQAHPGFPVTVSYNGNSYYGYAGYWGINFQGLDLNALADGPVSGATVKDQRPGNTTTYNLSKVSGKLTKWTRNQQTLADMDGVPFFAWADLTGVTSDTANVTGSENWEMHWDNTQGQFVVTGKQTCGGSGCVVTTLNNPATVNSGTFSTVPLSGWSDAFGGNIDIPATSAAHAGTDNLYYYSQSQVVPGSTGAPSALYCVNNCPTATSINNFVNSGAASPYDANTADQWDGSGTTSITYSFDSGGLKQSSTPMVVTDTNVLNNEFQFGVSTGRLFDSALPTSSCPNGGNVCEPSNPAVYYTWQTGADQWTQSMWLTRTSDGSLVSFDPPQDITYTVPSGSAYGTWAGKTIHLQFDGFGNLGGIPGHCVSGVDNSPTDCANANARYVPAFALPDGATMTLSGSGTSLIVKALDAELRLKQVSCLNTNLPQPTTNVTLPTVADVHDPSSSADSDYIGTKPTVTDPPKVISGVIQ